VEWSHVAQDRVKWWDLVNMVMNLWGHTVQGIS